MVTLRSYDCPRCGAPRQSLGDAIVTICTYCGVVATVEVSARVHASWTEAALEDIRNPERRSGLRRRRDKVYRRSAEAAQAKDRETWRAAMEELLVIDRSLLEHPAVDADDPETFLANVRRSIASQEVMTFDRDVVRWSREASEALAAILPEQDWSSGKARRQPGWSIPLAIERARAAIAAWTRVYAAVAERTGDDSLEPAALARDAVLSNLALMPATPGRPISKKEFRKISEGVAAGSFAGGTRCDHCGADLGPVAGGETVRCPSCGSVSRRV